jgi:hypothetical protein
LSLRLGADIHAGPRLLRNLNPHPADLPVRLEHAPAQGEAEHLDFSPRMLAGGLVDEGLQRLTGDDAVGPTLEIGGREVSFEADRHGEIAGIVAVAAPDDAQHPQTGFPLAARAKSRHARTLTCVPAAARRRARGVHSYNRRFR